MQPKALAAGRPGCFMALVLAASCLGACGSDGSGDDSETSDNTSAVTTATGGGTGGTFLPCSAGVEFHLAGNVEGQAIDITEAPSTGGFSQQSNPPGPHFRVPSASEDDDEQLVVVYLTWAEVVASGDVAPVQGWVRLPLGGPLPGQTICAGPGSEMTFPGSDDEDEVGDFQFRLRELSGGTDCADSLAGELDGCWRR